jgi:hypothetical protein
MIKSTVTWKIIKTTFEDAKFLQQDVVEMDDDDNWLRQNNSFVPMSRVTQPTNSYVSNPSIIPGEIPNVCEDFRVPRKRFRGANANNVGKLKNRIVCKQTKCMKQSVP